MPRPVPASTHVAALDRCTFQGLTTGRVSVSGHGITAPPARDLPEPWLSMLAHPHRRNTRAGPAGDGCAAAAVAFPELDGIRLAILGLHTCLGDTVLHMHASGPMCHAVYGPDELYSWPVIWIRDNGGTGTPPPPAGRAGSAARSSCACKWCRR